MGIESSPSFVRAPEGNGVAKRFNRTLKEQLLWVRTFDTVEELRQALLAFKERFNRHWLLQRHRYATPAQVRAAHTPGGGGSVNFVQFSIQEFGGFTLLRKKRREGRRVIALFFVPVLIVHPAFSGPTGLPE